MDSRAAERLCASLAAGGGNAVLEAGLSTPALMVEVRIDQWPRPREALPLVEKLSKAGKRVVATLRESREGGGWSGDLGEKLELLGEAALLGASWVDVEETLLSDARVVRWLSQLPADVGVIVSSHHTSPPPSSVPGPRVVHGVGGRRVVFKRVYTALEWEDNLTVLEADRMWMGRLVSFNMGEKGRPSRVLAPIVGAPFTFVYPESLGVPSASGQMSDWEMINVWRSLGFP